MKKAIYLKINRTEDYAFKNLSRWIDVSYLMGIDCYILCDQDNVIKRIQEEIFLSDICKFIKSDKNSINKIIVENSSNRNWENAAYAHLTTFSHTKDCKYDYFWNIDADDTMLCLTIDRIKELMENVEIYAQEHKIDCFSLDMWRTKWQGEHWSFGITYISGKQKWIEVLLDHCDDYEYQNLANGMNYNIDCLFSYLKNKTELNIETFYFENLKFIHYSNDFFKGLISSAFYHWKEGKLLYPIMQACVGINELSVFIVYSDIIKLDIKITDDEARNILTYYSKDGHEFRGYVDWHGIINQKLFHIKKNLYMKKYYNNCKIVCFGVGNCFDNNLEKIFAICDLKYVCDNDQRKWGKEFYSSVICIPPSELKKMKPVFVVITIYSKSVSKIIANQLEEMGISNYDFIDNFLKCIE